MLACMSHLRQTAIGFTMWSDDNGGSWPWQVSTNQGGTLELIPNGRAANHFLPLSKYMKDPRVFVCPTDQARRATNSYSSFGNQNLSYFAGLDARANSSNSSISILSGDRHLQVNGQPVKPGLLVASNSATFGWTKELHERGSSSPIGNLLFADGHVEIARSARLTNAFQRQSPLTNRLVIP
jgi:prepilin-type processing-associated H-X9-DG protein